ncbi:uncharacterized protein PV07_08665 [Cladophialophora immunda]|uniref:Uncharacterized protein n=1 Tax=Cladophialophora immunda TaxID=569365 RepID=A0A0D2CPP3_9EURO|nr:uncharacterized protein PV07_08665 [Cladophialophora immunda]KIW25499.1 hypothetical protein PV07_08665 [Cladophialophora immunda]
MAGAYLELAEGDTAASLKCQHAAGGLLFAVYLLARTNNSGIRNTHLEKDHTSLSYFWTSNSGRQILDVKCWTSNSGFIFAIAFLNMIPNGPRSMFLPIIINGFGFSTLNTFLLLYIPYGFITGMVIYAMTHAAYRWQHVRCWIIAVGHYCTTVVSPQPHVGTILLWLIAAVAFLRSRKLLALILLVGTAALSLCLLQSSAQIQTLEESTASLFQGHHAHEETTASLFQCHHANVYIYDYNRCRDYAGISEAFDYGYEDDLTDKKTPFDRDAHVEVVVKSGNDDAGIDNRICFRQRYRRRPPSQEVEIGNTVPRALQVNKSDSGTRRRRWSGKNTPSRQTIPRRAGEQENKRVREQENKRVREQVVHRVCQDGHAGENGDYGAQNSVRQTVAASPSQSLATFSLFWRADTLDTNNITIATPWEQQTYSHTPTLSSKTARSYCFWSKHAYQLKKTQRKHCYNWTFSTASNVHIAIDCATFKTYVSFKLYVLTVSDPRRVPVRGIGSVELKLHREPGSATGRVAVAKAVSPSMQAPACASHPYHCVEWPPRAEALCPPRFSASTPPTRRDQLAARRRRVLSVPSVGHASSAAGLVLSMHVGGVPPGNVVVWFNGFCPTPQNWLAGCAHPATPSSARPEVKKTNVPMLMAKAVKEGYEVTYKGLLAWCDHQEPADVPRFRLFLVAMEAAFANILRRIDHTHRRATDDRANMSKLVYRAWEVEARSPRESMGRGWKVSRGRCRTSPQQVKTVPA